MNSLRITKREKEDGDERLVHNPIFKPRAVIVDVIEYNSNHFWFMHFVHQLLLSDFEVVAALSDVALIHEEARISPLAEAMIDFFEAYQKTEKLLEWAVAREIVNTSKYYHNVIDFHNAPNSRCFVNKCVANDPLSASSNTLFRSTCAATKLMPVLYARLGKSYLKHIAGPLVKDITASGSSFEVSLVHQIHRFIHVTAYLTWIRQVDPQKAASGIDVKDNLKKVLSIASEFLQYIIASINFCPR